MEFLPVCCPFCEAPLILKLYEPWKREIPFCPICIAYMCVEPFTTVKDLEEWCKQECCSSTPDKE